MAEENEYSIKESTLIGIANAIRYVEESENLISVHEFADRIRALKGGEPIPRPDVPEGTWQLKTTTDKKYVIIGTDDDNYGNAKFFRLLRSYGFPYTMNVEAENAKTSHSVGNDVDESFFTSSDAPSLFTSGVDVITLGKYLHENDLGEVAQHGASGDTLWDSSKLTGTFLDNLYNAYTTQGGTKSKEELRLAIVEQKDDTDVQNDAPYVARSRDALESAYGFPILTVGAWGGSPSAEIDGITLNLNGIKGGAYDWQGHDYYGASTRVATWHINDGPYDIARMNDGNRDMTEYIDLLSYGKAVEFFWHKPFEDRSNLRGLMESLKALKDSGKIDVVTRYQYSQLGEYVDNPITSISVSRDGNLNVGDTDSDEAYSVTVTYADGTTGTPANDFILDRSSVDISIADTYEVKAYYRGFYAYCNVIVSGSGDTYPEELKSQPYWFVYSNDSDGNWYCGNITSSFTKASITNGVLLFNSTTGKINGWKSSDKGSTWEQVTTNRSVYSTTSTNRKSDTDGGYKFNSAWGMRVTWIETSGNFELDTP